MDLGKSPPSNELLTKESSKFPQLEFPLKAYVCKDCFLVQLDDFKKPEELFSSEYVYFSSISQSWLDHSKKYFRMIKELRTLNSDSFVIEIASNDGYLLQYFVNSDIPCLGIEPTLSTYRVSIQKGIPTLRKFFDIDTANEIITDYGRSDLVIGNNVLAHVPELNDFIQATKMVLKKDGIITMEFPHLLNLVEQVLFDTIYHEHFSYFSFTTVNEIFRKHGLEIFDVERISTHGGSLRIYAKHIDFRQLNISSRVKQLIKVEKEKGMRNIDYYSNFNTHVKKIRDTYRNFILEQKSAGKKLVAFGAAAKGNTFLNYCGSDYNEIEYVVDDTKAKQGKFLPKSRIPVVSIDILRIDRPDIIIVLPWNFKESILKRLSFTREWNAKIVFFIPKFEIH